MKKKNIKIEEFTNLHNKGFSPSQIAKKLNCSIANASKRLTKLGIKPHRNEDSRSRKNRYLINEEFFDNINSEEKAYILGLAYADGSVTKNAFYLKMKDEDILLKVKKAMMAEQNVKFINHNGYYSYLLSIYSQKISKSLIKQGCIPNKTFTLKFPTEEQVPKHLLNHFIRGYFDGDGCLSIDILYSQCKINFTSAAINFLKDLRELLINLTDRKGCLVKEKNNNTWHLKFSGTSVNIILSWMYKNSTIFMKRKYNKILIYKSVHIKQGELLETPTLERQKEDNQQPSLSSNTLEGSTTNSRIQNMDSNADTSALPGINGKSFKLTLDKKWFNNFNFGDDIV